MRSDETLIATANNGALPDTTKQTAAGKVLWHHSMSLDGFVTRITAQPASD